MSVTNTAIPLRPRSARPAAPDSVYESSSPRLTVIEGSKGQIRKTVAPILTAVLILFVLAIVLPLIVNTDMARMSYAIRDQRIILNEQTAIIETLEAELLVAESTNNLQQKAQEIGMVPAAPIGVISLQGGEIDGGVPAQ